MALQAPFEEIYGTQESWKEVIGVEMLFYGKNKTFHDRRPDAWRAVSSLCLSTAGVWLAFWGLFTLCFVGTYG